ncbi:methyltransferase family protein [Micromonospora pisi]|uniref:Methyltransferase family protein n=1 Tax=Micromonospora pisi TaxID=589240 RepID=A0A495JNL5_9ACTN|nr:class I SAM-dependent methyltransferase [Micromonospora pisi]RKR89629.1 methyltransferase family protein [Micromonospora pisi]
MAATPTRAARTEPAPGPGLGFRGEVVDFYHRYRRGYPEAVIDALVAAFGLTGDDTVVDLGCGTGQLAAPIARRVRAVVGVDPEPDMLSRARSAADGRGLTNTSWLLGTDTDLPALGALLGAGSVGAVTIGQALHWMRPDDLFPTLFPLVRPSGGVAVVTNGSPLWLQDTTWSRALRAFLERWSGRRLDYACGTDTDSHQRYRASLAAAGFETHETYVAYQASLDLEQLVGSLYSAFPVDQLPAPQRRPDFADQVRQALIPEDRFTEQVRVTILTGRKR